LSTIIKALKKVEDRTTGPRENTTRAHGLPAQQPLKPYPPQKKPYIRYAVGALGVLFLIAGGWWMADWWISKPVDRPGDQQIAKVVAPPIQKNNPPVKTPPPKEVRQKTAPKTTVSKQSAGDSKKATASVPQKPAPKTVISPKVEKRTPVKPKAIEPAKAQPVAQKIQPAPKKRTVAVNTKAAPRTQPGNTTKTSRDGNASTAPLAEPISKRPQRKMPKPSMKAKVEPLPTAKQKDATQNEFSSIPMLKSSEIKIQAIAWSPKPEKRIAVIDGNIVGEGSSVDNYSIIQIQPDEIVVSKSGQKFRLLFTGR
jgi:Type II secretion system protein B